jgi:endogenous inhibitor of DNA gyrase (YacG/DUF329 family)
MIHKINVKCNKCQTNIIISIDDNFNIIKIEHDNITKNKCSCRCKNIEFGLLKEGEDMHER